jgi:enoyl-CoA hydratase
VTLALLRRGRTLSYREVVPLEYRLMQACIAREDFHEGIRAVLVEKHGQPHWRPAHLADVDAAEVEAAFRPEGKDALAPGGAPLPPPCA